MKLPPILTNIEFMSEDRKAARLKEISESVDFLSNHRLIGALPEETLIELHQALGTVVSLIQHMEEGED
ncbi:MAG: hypothetical protein PVJ69_12575 [Desulfobacteraceae bacterium]